MKTEKLLHEKVWSRFIRMPYGHLIDYTDLDGTVIYPTKEDCDRCMPNTLSWWTPIENGSFFTGLYATALIHKYSLCPDEQTAKEIEILMNGLKLLQEVGSVDGFIARGVATDGKSHYPYSSEDQVAPWLIAMISYYQSPLCNDKDDIKNRMLTVLRAIKSYGWKIPCDIKDKFVNNWLQAGDFRAVCMILYFSYMLAILEGNDLTEYRQLLDSVPENSTLTRRQIVSRGFGFDMKENPSLVQFWIFVSAHLCLYRLSKLDKQNSADFCNGCIADARESIPYLDGLFRYDNEKTGFDINFRLLEQYYEKPYEKVEDNIKLALRMVGPWMREIVPHRRMEHSVLGDAVFGAWIALTCDDEDLRKQTLEKLQSGCERVDWDSLHLCYAFAAESAFIFAK